MGHLPIHLSRCEEIKGWGVLELVPSDERPFVSYSRLFWRLVRALPNLHGTEGIVCSGRGRWMRVGLGS